MIPLAILAALFASTSLLAGLWALLVHRYPGKPRADEAHFIATEDGWRIAAHRHRPKDPGAHGEPVLLCHGIFVNHRNFEAPAGGAIVDSLTEAGYDCWALDYRICRSAHAPAGERFEATLDDVLLKDLPAAIQHIQERTGFSRIHWVGHSLGGMLFFAYEIVHGAAAVASATVLGAPPRFDGVHMTRRRLLGLLFYHVPTVLSFVVRLGAPLVFSMRLRSRLLPINWANVHPDVTPGVFFHLVDLAPYPAAREAEEWAVTGRWVMNHGKTDVAAETHKLRTPLLGLYAAYDPLARRENVVQLFDSLSHGDKKLIVLSTEFGYSADYNHVDLAFARRGREETHRPIVEWLRAYPATEPETAASLTRSE
ncbi:MAG: alpha/beta fold hydrolase [Candidatus Hydrogenedentota bacterium]